MTLQAAKNIQAQKEKLSSTRSINKTTIIAAIIGAIVCVTLSKIIPFLINIFSR
jgi:uncharacterized membrane protein YeaQ/YmgE (transglycosylase-associated protein family)